MASPESSPLKRTYDQAELEDAVQDARHAPKIVAAQSLPHSVVDSLGKPSLPSSPVDHNRHSSPLPKDVSSVVGNPCTQSAPAPHTVSTTSKKPKLTAAERESKKLEREAKDRQKAEEKIKKEEEKRLKDAEKEERRRLKEEHSKLKEEEKKLKEDEKKRKDEEKRLKEGEKEKKAKSQLRLNAFFVQPPASANGLTGSPCRESRSPQSSRRNSVASTEGAEAKSRGRSTSATPQKAQLRDYERSFLPFWVQPHTTLAPHNRFSRDDEGTKYVQSKIDECISPISGASGQEDNVFNLYDLLHISSHQYKGPKKPHYAVKDIIKKTHGSAQHPVDLTSFKAHKVSKPVEMLRSISIKYLRFAEDVRPPYIGTYTKFLSDCKSRELCKNPFIRALPQINYDYDSEAEWEEPGEGEDLDSEGEEEVNEEDEDDDMEGFLDDEESGDGIRTVNQKRRTIMSDLEPSCTGLCWEDDGDANRRALASEKNPVDLQIYNLEVILDRPQLPIDPYSTAYWHSTSVTKSLGRSPSKSSHASMNPPRIPLNSINRTNVLFPNLTVPASGLKIPSPGEDISATAKPPRPPKRLIPPEVMNDFKIAVQGNDLTKAGLVEILKKHFPKQSKDAIKDTLGLIAERVGSKEANKRWTIKAEYQQ